VPKNYQSINVYEAARERIIYCFNNFDIVQVAFSGGKDSGVMLNLTLEIAEELDVLDRVIVFFQDCEAQYTLTHEYIVRAFESLPKQVDKYWICLPTTYPTSCSMHQTFWKPWKKSEHDIWVRKMPEYEYVINEDNAEFNYDCSHYEFVKFVWPEYLLKKIGKSICTLVGIRADESYDRYRSIALAGGCKDVPGTTNGNIYVAWPIYDWTTTDVWVANAKFAWDYNKLYDMFYLAGLPAHEMRVASPFIEQGQDNLKLYKTIEPHTWGKMVSRVNGVNFTSIYGGTTAMGWKNITKPEHFTWQEYANFLLSTLNKDIRDVYLDKLKTSIKFWKEKGGMLNEAPEEYGFYRENGLVKVDIYPDNVEGVKEFSKFPSWKRFCICILKNDITCKYMGFAFTKKENEKRKAAMEKWNNLL